jgi:Domain of unknown function (DUF6883)
MRLPGIDDAVVDDGKNRDYLLSESHPVGRFKAAFFSALGYSVGKCGDQHDHCRRVESAAEEDHRGRGRSMSAPLSRATETLPLGEPGGDPVRDAAEDLQGHGVSPTFEQQEKNPLGGSQLAS